MSTRVLVTGSRTWTDERVVNAALDECRAYYGDELVIVHGACPQGADAIAARWCEWRGVTQEAHRAQWDRHGRRAGMVRNAVMVDTRPAGVLAFIKDGSPGASHCVREAEAKGIPVRRWDSITEIHLPANQMTAEGLW